MLLSAVAGKRLGGVAVAVNTVANINQGKEKNIANAFGNIAYRCAQSSS